MQNAQELGPLAVITANKPISGLISLQIVDLGEDYTQKVQENFKKLSTSDTITYESPYKVKKQMVFLNKIFFGCKIKK